MNLAEHEALAKASAPLDPKGNRLIMEQQARAYPEAVALLREAREAILKMVVDLETMEVDECAEPGKALLAKLDGPERDLQDRTRL